LNTKVKDISVVIPTYGRDEVLLKTLAHLLGLQPGPHEILVIDQTSEHKDSTSRELARLDKKGSIGWIRLGRPSIPHAMNVGLLKAKHEIVLFLDDDIIPGENLIAAHVHAHSDVDTELVAGRVIQPWEVASGQGRDGGIDPSSEAQKWVNEFMGGNFSVKRSTALKLGGFDENFVRVAYRFERDFADRLLAAGGRILFEPRAIIHHLKVSHGGTRSYGDHLKTIKPNHSVGEYYYLMRSVEDEGRFKQMFLRILRAVKTRHHLLRPWWIPVTLISELLGFIWALKLCLGGPNYISPAVDNLTS